MIAQSWIVVCDRCPQHRQFAPTKPPDRMTDPDKLYRNREQLPTVIVDKQEVLDELAKLGWLITEKEGEICPQCRGKRTKRLTM